MIFNLFIHLPEGKLFYFDTRRCSFLIQLPHPNPSPLEEGQTDEVFSQIPPPHRFLCRQFPLNLSKSQEIKVETIFSQSKKSFQIHVKTYSVRRLFTGFANAAFIAWKLTVSNAINKAVAPAAINIDQPILIRYAKSCSHLCITK